MIELLFASPAFTDAALFANRVLLGLFFVLARFRYFYDPIQPIGDRWLSSKRHASLTHKMEYCGLKHATLWAPFVAAIEVLAGMAVIVGLLTPLASLGLLIILIRATMCTGAEKTMRQNPVDRVDVASCYLWTPEPVYIGLAFIAVCLGAGAWSLDAIVFAWFQ